MHRYVHSHDHSNNTSVMRHDDQGGWVKTVEAEARIRELEAKVARLKWILTIAENDKREAYAYGVREGIELVEAAGVREGMLSPVDKTAVFLACDRALAAFEAEQAKEQDR